MGVDTQWREEEEEEEKPKPNSQSHLGHRARLQSTCGYNQSLVWKVSHTLAWKLSHRFQVHAWNIPFRNLLGGCASSLLLPDSKEKLHFWSHNQKQWIGILHHSQPLC